MLWGGELCGPVGRVDRLGMPASAAVIANLTTRKDLNYPTEAEVQSALDSKRGSVRDAVDLLRQRAAKQPRRKAPEVTTAEDEHEVALSPAAQT
eukprot:COSAG02_NODE_37479_length_441_cov_1.052632_1_plen_93_part_10